MRIISGFLKRKKINYLKNLKTRPLKDSVKENIFNVLEHSNLIKVKMINANVLDLYSGIGSFGIECISRGAEKVTFIEKDKFAIKILKENLTHLGINNKSRLIFNNIENTLKDNLNEIYNIFFLDPPFSNKDYIKNLKLIRNSKIFKKDHIIVIHREVKSKDQLNHLMKIIFEKEYGRSKLIFGFFI